jgi:hypothetical protein
VLLQPLAGTAAPINGSVVQVGPKQTVGTSFHVTSCGFAPHAAVAIDVDDASSSNAVAGPRGCATFEVVVSDPHLTVEGGTSVSMKLGENEITSVGTNSAGGTQTDTYTFSVVKTLLDRPTSLGFTSENVMAGSMALLALVALAFLVLTFSRPRTARS